MYPDMMAESWPINGCSCWTMFFQSHSSSSRSILFFNGTFVDLCTTLSWAWSISTPINNFSFSWKPLFQLSRSGRHEMCFLLPHHSCSTFFNCPQFLFSSSCTAYLIYVDDTTSNSSLSVSSTTYSDIQDCAGSTALPTENEDMRRLEMTRCWHCKSLTAAAERAIAARD